MCHYIQFIYSVDFRVCFFCWISAALSLCVSCTATDLFPFPFNLLRGTSLIAPPLVFSLPRPCFVSLSIGIFFPADLFASINGKRTTHKDNDVRLLEIRIFPIWLSHNRHYTAERNSQARTNGKFIFKYYTNELPYVGASALQIICVQQIRVFDGNKSGKGVKGGSFIHYSDCLHIFFHLPSFSLQPPVFSFHFRRLYVSEKSCACVWPSFAADRQYQQKWYENKYHLWNGFVISMRCHIKLN